MIAGQGRSGPKSRRTEAPEASATGQDQATLPPRQPWSTFGPHAIGAERFPAVSSGLKGASVAQVAGLFLGEQAAGQNPDKDEVSSPACDRSCRARLIRSFVAHAKPPAWVRPGLPGGNASDADRRRRRTGRWIGLSGQIAADLLPEAGDSRAVDGGEGRWPGVELRGFEPLTPCMPSMRGWFTSPCATSATHATERVKGAAEGWVVGRRQVTCSVVSGKFLARAAC